MKKFLAVIAMCLFTLPAFADELPYPYADIASISTIQKVSGNALDRICPVFTGQDQKLFDKPEFSAMKIAGRADGAEYANNITYGAITSETMGLVGGVGVKTTMSYRTFWMNVNSFLQTASIDDIANLVVVWADSMDTLSIQQHPAKYKKSDRRKDSYFHVIDGLKDANAFPLDMFLLNFVLKGDGVYAKENLPFKRLVAAFFRDDQQAIKRILSSAPQDINNDVFE